MTWSFVASPRRLASSPTVAEVRRDHDATAEARCAVLTAIESVLALEGFLLDGRTNGRRPHGRSQYLCFPARTTASGERRSIPRPPHEAARLAFQREVFAAIGLDEGGAV